MSVIHHAHDNFFRSTMGNMNVATEFLERHLPAKVLVQLDLKTLALQPGTYVSKALQSSASDVLFKVNYKEKPGFVYIYILVEQQSSVEHLMPYRLLDYILSIWGELIKKDEKKSKRRDYQLPLIIPLVFYSGPEQYNGTTDIRDLIAAPRELIEAFLFTPFQLIDLRKITDEEMRAKKWAGVVEFIMRHIHEREALNYIQPLLEFLWFLAEEGATILRDTVLHYVLSEARTADPERLGGILSKNLEDKSMATYVDYLIEQNKGRWVQAGVEQGIEQGVQKGECALLIRQLEYKFKTIPKHYRQKIEAANAEVLLEWSTKVLTSQSLQEVFDI